MTWNYRVAEKRRHYGSQEVRVYGIIEVYYDSTGKPRGHTDFIDPNDWEDIQNLKGTLEKMLQAFDKPVFETVLEDME